MQVCRYVDRNPVNAGLIKRAEYWPWSGLNNKHLLSEWPIEKPSNYIDYVNSPQTDEELRNFELLDLLPIIK